MKGQGQGNQEGQTFHSGENQRLLQQHRKPGNAAAAQLVQWPVPRNHESVRQILVGNRVHCKTFQ